MSTEKPLPFIYQFAAGAVAGVSEILVMYPLDVVKTRVQLQGRTPIPGQDHYSGMLDCFRKIIKNEGYISLPHGHEILGAACMLTVLLSQCIQTLPRHRRPNPYGGSQARDEVRCQR